MTADRPATEPRPCPVCQTMTTLEMNDDGVWEYIPVPAEAAQGAAPRAEGLDPELAAIYLAAAMKECGYTATEADARSILDYLDGDNGVALTRRPSDERAPESEERA